MIHPDVMQNSQQRKQSLWYNFFLFKNLFFDVIKDSLISLLFLGIFIHHYLCR